MEIETALQGREVCDSLRNDLRKIRYNPDLIKMHHNLENMVTNISKLEVECRRGNRKTLLEQPLQEFNKAVDHLRKLILMAQLME